MGDDQARCAARSGRTRREPLGAERVTPRMRETRQEAKGETMITRIELIGNEQSDSNFYAAFRLVFDDERRRIIVPGIGETEIEAVSNALRASADYLTEVYAKEVK